MGKKVMTDWIDVEELAAYILELDDDYDSDAVEQGLYDKFEISFDKFHDIVSALAPLCEVGTSPITEEKFRGFAKIDEQCWIVKVNA